MSTSPSNASSNSVAGSVPSPNPETKQIVLEEIMAKWGKFSEQDLPALKGKDDLVKEVVAKYGLERGQAQRDVDALLKGRQI